MTSLKQLLRSKDVVLGASTYEWLRPALVKIYKQAGFDFIYLEYEHCLMNPTAFSDFVVSANDNDMPVVAKTPDLLRHIIAKILETGLSGIQLPRTNTAQDIAKFINFSKYPPLGTRAGVTGMASTNYALVSAVEHMKKLNEELAIIAHVETAEGLENIESIMAEPGIDICYVGTFDLAAELGVPGEMNSPVVLKALDRICAACNKNNVVVGTNGTHPETVRMLRQKGIRIFYGPSELDFVRRAASHYIREASHPVNQH